MVLVFQPSKPAGRHATSLAKASSVPGRMHTANPGSSDAENPRVPVPKSRVTSLSPTFAGRDRTLWRLKSHIGDSLSSQSCATPPHSRTDNAVKAKMVPRFTEQKDISAPARPGRARLTKIAVFGA